MIELKFKRDTAFRKQFFVPDSFSHPAKMDAQLLIWIVQNFTRADHTILDPMAGSGTTMLACGLGRNVILVELEEKFCKMMWANWQLVKMKPRLGYDMGSCQIIQGDARDLEGLLCDAIVTSPPYAESKEVHDIDFLKNTAGDASERVRTGKAKGHFFTKEARERALAKKEQGLIDNPLNIGNLSYGSIDSIVTSPPYAEVSHHTDDPLDTEKYRPGRSSRVAGTAGENKNNIGQFPYGNIDAVVTSPPYEGSISGESHTEEARAREFDKLRTMGYKINPNSADNKVRGAVYSGSEENIGNLKSESYLQAMKLVYQQCYKVLKPNGLLILVLKNFIRNKQVIRLDLDTIKLCEQAGFKLAKRYERKLPSQSFWRIIYHQKHPEVDQIKFEDVLIFGKI